MKTTESGQMNQNTELVKRLEERDELLAYINSTPILLSLLYDLDLMPEQSPDGSTERDMMFLIASHFREALSTQERVIVELREALDQVSDMLEDAYVGCEDAAKAYGITKIVKKARALSKGSGQ